jgi:cell wall-associated NlpC family hydrolase
MMRLALPFVMIISAALLAACGSPSPRPAALTETIAQPSRVASAKGVDVVLYALGLVDTGYRFGGKNPNAGLDCSGMVSHIYQTTLGLKVKGSAADIARQARVIERQDLRPGDLVFFNTSNRSFSHVGIYIGDARFVHAPSTNGRVRIDRLGDRYYAQRYEAARTFFD